MVDLFIKYSDLIVLFHILGAIIWVGGMVVIKLAVHPVLHSLESLELRVEKNLLISERLFKLVAPFIVIILLTGLVIAIATNGHHTNLSLLFILKESIWTLMSLNYIFMIFRLRNAKKLFKDRDIKGSINVAKIIPNILLPINILLGVLALYIGVKLRGF